MFEDMPDDVDGFEVDSGSSDRERHPTELRFLLLNAYEEQVQPTIPDVWTPKYFEKKVGRVLDESKRLEHRRRSQPITRVR